jgi:subtilisin family serine protease
MVRPTGPFRPALILALLTGALLFASLQPASNSSAGPAAPTGSGGQVSPGDDDGFESDDDDGFVAPPGDETSPSLPPDRRGGGPIVDEDGDPTTDGYRANQAVIRLHEGAAIDLVNIRLGTTTLAALPERGLYLVEVVGGESGAALVARLSADPDVAWVELNHVSQAPEGRPGYIFVTGAPDATGDSGYATDLLGLAAAHACASGGGVVVAVLDTGADETHPALAGRVLSRGYNALTGTTDTSDAANGLDDDGDGLIDELSGHGTHVAGIVLQVAPGATILPVTVLDSDGVGDAFFLAEGIYYAIAAGARVVNLSLGSTVDARVVREAISAAANAGVVIVAAAGNAGRDRPVEHPAGHPEALAIAATDAADRKSEFSSYGDHIALAAPGTEISSALPGGGYAVWSGTSMATPFVAGAAALLLGANRSQTSDDVRGRLLATSVDLDAIEPLYAGSLGAGRLDIAAAVGCAG